VFDRTPLTPTARSHPAVPAPPGGRWPGGPSQWARTKVFRTGGWFTPEDRIPKRLHFDLGLEPTAPTQNLNLRINQEQPLKPEAQPVPKPPVFRCTRARRYHILPLPAHP